MSSKKTPVKLLLLAALLSIVALSFRSPSDESATGISFLMEPDGTGIWRELTEKFNRTHPDVRVQLVEGPPATNTREDMYAAGFLAGDGGYDVVYSDVIWVPKFAAAGWLLDLTDRISSEDREDFLPADLRGGTYKGRLYRVPLTTDAGLLYYRKDLVPRPPETFDELLDTASRLQTPELWGFVWQGKQYEGLVTNFLEVLWGYGGEWIDADTREVFLDSPEGIAAVNFMRRAARSISPPGVTTYIEEDARNLFQNGRAVFLRNWLYVAVMISRGNSPVKGEVAWTRMVHAPGQQGAASLGGWGLSISKFTANPDAAWAFVEFMSRPEQLRAIRERAGLVPARRDLVPEEFRSIIDSARPRPAIPEYAQASDILQRWLSAALANQVPSDDAMRRAAAETRLLLRGTDQ